MELYFNLETILTNKNIIINEEEKLFRVDSYVDNQRAVRFLRKAKVMILFGRI